MWQTTDGGWDDPMNYGRSLSKEIDSTYVLKLQCMLIEQNMLLKDQIKYLKHKIKELKSKNVIVTSDQVVNIEDIRLGQRISATCQCADSIEVRSENGDNNNIDCTDINQNAQPYVCEGIKRNRMYKTR